MKHNFLKKLTALLLGAIMVLSMIPAIAVSTKAAGETYKLVTNVSELEAGATYLLVAKGKNKTMGAQSGSYRTGVDVTISNNTITTVPSNAQLIVLGGTSGAWTLTVGGSYLYWDSGNSIKVRASDTNSQSKWKISISNDGTATITNGSDSTRKLQWNASSPRFATYSSSQTAVQLYKLEEKTESSCAHTNTDIIGTPSDATCTEPGITAGKKCSDCGATLENQETIPALGHKYDAGVCTVCGEEAELFELVTDASKLQAGDKIIIVNSANKVALSTTQNNNNRGKTSVAIDANKKIPLTPDVQVITLEAGKVAGTFAFNTGKGYLYAASSGSNHLKTQTTLDNNGSWLISITTAGVATIKAQGTNTNNWIRYNNNNSIFSCYASGQLDVSIYKLVVAEPEPEPVTPDAELKSFGLTLSKSITIRVKLDISEEWFNTAEDKSIIISGFDSIEVTEAGIIDFEINLTPGKINSIIKVTVGNMTEDISVAAYIKKAKVQHADNAALLTLLDAIDAYGKVAANKGVPGTVDFSGVDAPIVDDELGLFGSLAIDAVLNDYANIGIAVNATENLAYTITFGGNTAASGSDFASIVTDGKLVIENLRPANYNDEIVITVTNEDGENASITLTFNSYLKLLYEAEEGYEDIAAATYAYGLAVEAYIASTTAQ